MGPSGDVVEAKPVGSRELANPRAGRLVVEVEALEGLGLLPSLTVEVRIGEWDARITGRAGERFEFEVPVVGEGRISILESNSWLGVSESIELVEDEGTKAALLAVPRRVILGRVMDSESGRSLERFRVSTETALHQGGQGTATYEGSPISLSAPDGRFAIVPYQNASRHRLTIEADEHRSVTTDWFEVSDAGRVDLGELLLDPREVRTVTLSVVSAETGERLRGVDVLVSENPVRDAHLVVSDGGLHSRAKYEARLRTDEAGECDVSVEPETTRHLVLASATHPIGRARIEPDTIARGKLEVALQAGGRVTFQVHVPESVRTQVVDRRIEARSANAQRQAGLASAVAGGPESAHIGGLPLGLAQIGLVGDAIAADGARRKIYLASALLDITGDPAQEHVFDLTVPSGRGFQGVVRLPVGFDGVPLTASWYEHRTQRLPERGVGVVSGAFRLPCDSNEGVVVLTGLAASQDVAFGWFESATQIDIESTIDIDLGATELVGEHGPLAPEWFEMVTVTPAAGHPLHGVPGCVVRVYPSKSGSFRVFGLPTGPYLAVADFTGKEAQFTIQAEGRTTVELTLPE